MRLADDERGRVPFALVGVVLLLASTGYATTLAQREAPPTHTRTDLAIDRAQTEIRLALARAAVSAGRAAAANPVQEAADTPYGRVIAGDAGTGAGVGAGVASADDAFHRSLRLRIYLAAQQALTGVQTQVGPVTVTAAVPVLRSPADARRAIEQVRVAAVNRTRLRAALANVTVTVRREARVVERFQYTPAVVAPSPVLALHERTARFDAMLDRGPLEGPGLGRRLTPLLYAIAWGRGYAQYARDPVANVLANRHVELATNLGLAQVQRSAFGRLDPRVPQELGAATARVAARDFTTSLQVYAENQTTKNASDRVGLTLSVANSVAGAAGQPDSREPLPVDVNVTADRAFVGFVDGDDSSFASVLRAAYAADVRLVSAVDRTQHAVSRNGSAPAGWVRLDSHRRVSQSVSAAAVSPPAVRQGTLLASYGRRVVTTTRIWTRWTNGTATVTTSKRVRTVDRVALAVAARRHSSPYLPSTAAGLFRGATGREIRQRAVETLVTARGGPNTLAERAATDQTKIETVETNTRTVYVPVPERVRNRAYWSVARLRDAVRNRSVSVPRHAIATDANPAQALATALSRDRDVLLSSPGENVTAVAITGVEAAYLDRVVSRLTNRGSLLARAQAELAGLLRNHGVSPELPPLPMGSGTAPGVVAIDGSPTYLTLTEATPAGIAGLDEPYYPLAARNLNLFTVPYGDAADVVANAVLPDPPADVSLATAARTLRAANSTLASTANRSLRIRRDRLQVAVEAAVDRSAIRFAAALRETRPAAGSTLRSRQAVTFRDRRAVVDRALASWPTVHARALAVVNGSLAELVADRAMAVTATRTQHRLSEQRAPDLLAARLRAETTEVAQNTRVRVPQGPVEAAETATRKIAKSAISGAVGYGVQEGAAAAKRRLLTKSMAALPAGLPLAPVPGYWYATANVWLVSVRGGYARFTVQSANTTPTANLTYVRAADSVAFDVDGDGQRDEIGRTTPVEFATEVAVIVVVPPNGPGVGDVDGDADERSAGWGVSNADERSQTWPEKETPFSPSV